MLVSIIIPLYNQAEYLEDAIRSALANKPHEVIVVNDDSTDDWEEICFAYKDNIKLITKNNGGLSSARNAGIREATGDYIITLDADDKLPPDYIKQLSKIKADIVGCGYKTFGDYEKEWKSRGLITLEDLIEGNRTHCSALFKREIWDKIGGFDENMKHGWEDWDFWIRAVIAGYTMECTDKTHLLYRKHGHSMVSDNPKFSEENKKYMTEKYLRLLK